MVANPTRCSTKWRGAKLRFTAVPALPEQSISSHRNLVRMAAFYPTRPRPEAASEISQGANKRQVTAAINADGAAALGFSRTADVPD
jgi:hypothetical protein